MGHNPGTPELVAALGPYWTMVVCNIGLFIATVGIGQMIGERFNFKLSSQDQRRIAFLGTAASVISAGLGLCPIVPIFAGLAVGIALDSYKK